MLFGRHDRKDTLALYGSIAYTKNDTANRSREIR
jgi:hypothetical protein